MTFKVTNAMIENLVRRINIACGQETEACHVGPGGAQWSVGTFLADRSASGWALMRVSNKEGGLSYVTGLKRHRSREFHPILTAFLDGVDCGKAHAAALKTEGANDD